MGDSARILVIADSDRRAGDILLNLVLGKTDLEYRRVSSREEFLQALERGDWAMVVADGTAKGLSSGVALSLIEQHRVGMPFFRVGRPMGRRTAELAFEGGGLADFEVKRLEDLLRESEQKYRQLVNRAPIGIFRTTIEGRVIEANPTMLEKTGYDSIESLNRVGLENLYADGSDRARLIEACCQGPVTDFKTRFRRIDGSIIQVSMRAHMVVDEQGNPQFLEGTIEDITEREVAEKALRDSEYRLRSLVEAMTDWIWEVDADGKYIYASPQLECLLGYEPEEVIGKTPFDFMTAEEAERVGQLFGAIKDSQEQFLALENTMLHRTGRSVVLETSAVPFFSEDGSLAGYRGVDRDITERKTAERALRESQEMLQLVLDSIPVRVFWKDRNSVYLGCNRMLAEDAGLDSPDEIVGMTDYDMVWSPEETEFYRKCDQRVMESDTPEYHIIEPQLRKDGTQAWLDTNKVPLHDAEGRVVGILGTYEDITERRRFEVELAKRNVELTSANEELERLHQVKDEFIAMVSHEFRTPLVTGMGYLEMLLRGQLGSLSDEAYDKMNVALRNLRRLSRLIEDILSFHRLSRKDIQFQPRLGPVDLRKLLAECVQDFLMNSGRQPGRVRVEIDPHLLVVLADEDMIGQVLSNLLNNAERHAGEKAIVTLRTRAVAADRVRLSVEDNGVGMRPDLVKTAFEPFVTSSRLNRGTGLGLAIVRAILEAHHCSATIESEPGRGTKIWFELPAFLGSTT